MSQHLDPPELKRYRERKLSAAELQAIDDHIGECAGCREQLNNSLGDFEHRKASLLTEWTDMVAGVEAETDHLSYEDVAAYVSRELQPESLEKAQHHLDDCAECEERVEKLTSFRDEVESAPASRRPEIAPGFWDGFPSLRFPRLSPLQLIPAAAAAALFVAAGLWFAWSSTRSPSALLALSDGGGRVTLDDNGNVTGPKSLPPSYQQLIKTALMTGEVAPPPAVVRLLAVTGSLRGGAADDLPIALVGPVATAVMTDRPTLRWQPLPGTASYTVTISDRGKEVATSPPLAQTEWAVPDPLPRGVTYTWQVMALKDGSKILSPAPPAPEAQFRVLEKEKAEELAVVREQYAGTHSLLGSLYTQAGLLDDAEREFQALVLANPDSPVARKLLDNVTALRR